MTVYVAIKWCEDPPKWDVVPIKEIRGRDSSCLKEEDVSIDDTVKVKYGKGWFPAKVVAKGCKEDMEDAVREIENGISSDSESEEENEEMGRGRRKKKRKHTISSDDEESQEVLHSASQKAHGQRLKKHHDERQSKRVLAELSNKSCLSCSKKDHEMKQLRDSCAQKDAEITSLKAAVAKIEGEVHAIRQLTDVTSDINAATKQLMAVVERTNAISQVESTPTRAGRASRSPSRHADTPRRPGSSAGAGVREASWEAPAAPGNVDDTAEGDMTVTIGASGTTRLSRRVYSQMNWSGDRRKAGRDLLVAIFGREVLARSSLTGTGTHNPNMASGSEAKPALDPVKLADVLDFMEKKLRLTKSEARTVVRSKLCDESKMMRKKNAGV